MDHAIVSPGDRLTIRPIYQTRKQLEFRRSPAFVRGFVAGRGAGKTMVGARDVLLRASAGEPWMSVSPSYPIIHETTMPTLIEEARRLGVLIRAVKSPLPRVTFRTQDGGQADIVMRSGEDPEKLRGPNKAGLWIDEASITSHDVMLLGMAVLRYRGRMGSLILTFTPRGRQHWTFDVFFERAEPDGVTSRIVEPEAGGDRFLERINPDTGVVTRRKIHCYGGLDYVRTPNTHLVQATTLDNPFLPAEFYSNIRQHYTAALAAQELAGEFVDIEGLMFKRAWFQSVDEVPRQAKRVRYWDRAVTPQGGNYSAGVLMARDPRGIYYVEHVIRGQWSAADRDAVMVQIANEDARRYGNEVIIYVEQEGGSGGKEVAQQAVVRLAGHPIYVDVLTGKRIVRKDRQVFPGEAKVVRAQPFAAQAEAGNVRLKAGRWNHEYLEELCAFPHFTYDDQVDASSGAFNKLTKMTLFVGGEIRRTQVAAVKTAEERFGVRLQASRASRRRASGDGRPKGEHPSQ